LNDERIITLSELPVLPWSVLAPDLAGDYNDDGIVSAADYIVWRNRQGTDFELPNRDPNVIGNVGLEDYAVWSANFGNASAAGSGSNPVPEPAAWISAAMIAVCSAAARRRILFRLV
jgi:hypothetical protein